MKVSLRKTAMAVGMVLLLGLSGAVSRLRADSGSCNGANLTLPFNDVAGSSAFCYIAELYFLGVTGGCGGGSYCPGAPVTREQMAIFLDRTHDSALKRGSRHAALGQWWTQQFFDPKALTAVGDTPVGVQSDGKDLWVANYLSGTVTRVRASDGKVIGTWAGMVRPRSLLVANGRVYVTGGLNPGKLYAIDPGQPAGNAVAVADVGNEANGIAFDGEHILTANFDHGGVTNYHVLSGSKITYTNGFNQPGRSMTGALSGSPTRAIRSSRRCMSAGPSCRPWMSAARLITRPLTGRTSGRPVTTTMPSTWCALPPARRSRP